MGDESWQIDRAALQETADAIQQRDRAAAAAPVEREPFGAWLLKQVKRDDWIGSLAKGMKADPRFPRSGDVEAVRKRLGEMRASGDDFEALDDAELEYLAY